MMRRQLCKTITKHYPTDSTIYEEANKVAFQNVANNFSVCSKEVAKKSHFSSNTTDRAVSRISMVIPGRFGFVKKR